MSIQELMYSFLPPGIMLAVMVLLTRKTGAFGQLAHRRKVEELLERIAVAVEKRNEA